MSSNAVSGTSTANAMLQRPAQTTLTTTTLAPAAPRSPGLRLRLNQQTPSPDEAPRVTWATGTVDNEHMGKKKSKCCCIYEKPRAWDESPSTSESEMECEHCYGHVELKGTKKKKPPQSPGSSSGSDSEDSKKAAGSKGKQPSDKGNKKEDKPSCSGCKGHPESQRGPSTG